MKVLWVTSQPIGAAVAKFSYKAASGTWMDPALKDVAANEDVEVSVACLAPVDEMVVFAESNVTYYCVPRTKKAIYPYKSAKCEQIWKEVLSRANPDIMMVWGTEYAHGLCALRMAEGLPSVVIIQGLLSTVERYYLADLTAKDLRRAYTFRNFLKRDSLRQQKRIYAKRAIYEKEILTHAKNVIIENNWEEANIKAHNPGCVFHEYRLMNNPLFFTKQWKADECEKFSIFCTAPVGYPIKGFHNVVKALSIICKEHPETVLRVPGMSDPFKSSFVNKLKRDGYTKHIMNVIEEYGVREHIQFLGRLDSEQMAEELLRANVFVLPSALDNTSTSLREAMAVGTPSVASYVGGMPETIIDGKTGRLYRFEEYEQMAYMVLDLMDDPVKAQSMGDAGREYMHRYLSELSDGKTLISIFKTILSKN